LQFNGGSVSNNLVVAGAGGAGGSKGSSGHGAASNGTTGSNGASFGGGLFLQAGTATISGTTIEEDQANGNGSFDGGGGGIFFSGSSLTIKGSGEDATTPANINCCEAICSGGGGGLLVSGSGTVNISNTNFFRNKALAGSGGAINYSGSATMSLNTVDIILNQASVKGGGIFHGASGTVRLQQTIAAGNTAPVGPDLSGTFVSQGHNTVGNGSGETGIVNGVNNDKVGTASHPIPPPFITPDCPGQVNVTKLFRIYYGDYAYNLGHGIYGFLFTLINVSGQAVTGPITLVFPTLPASTPVLGAKAGNGAPTTHTNNSVTVATSLKAGESLNLFIIFPSRTIGLAQLGLPTEIFAGAGD
jgi:hypothetical protein